MSLKYLLINEDECYNCPMLTGSDECILQDGDVNFNADTFDDLQKTCPLREIPEKCDRKKAKTLTVENWIEGWNACIDNLLEKKE